MRASELPIPTVERASAPLVLERVGRDTARSWWNDTRQSVHARVAQLRAEREDHHAARDVKKAERRAEEAEQDAADAVDFALAMLDEAEYALADAALARIDADELAVRELA
jgi:hypothetical protein